MSFLTGPQIGNAGSFGGNSNEIPTTSNGNDAGPTNVYVAGFPPTVTEANLKQHFMTYGEVESAKIMVDPMGVSKGAGFVKFTNASEAQTAVGALNGSVLQGAEIKVRFAQPKKNNTSSSSSVSPLTPFGTMLGMPVSFGGGGYGPMKTHSASDNRFHPFNNNNNNNNNNGSTADGHNVYVCGFPKNWTKDDLSGHFAAFGSISNCHVMNNKQTGEGRGAGFLKFQTFQEASNAIDATHNTIVEGAPARLQVRFAREQTAKEDVSTAQQTALIYQQYQALASPYLAAGAANYLQVATTPGTNYSQTNSDTSTFDLQSGLLNPYWALQQQQYAAAAVAAGMGLLNPASLMGSSSVGGGSGEGGTVEGACLFVMHIPNDWRDDNLRQLFADYGTTTQVKVIMDNQTGNNKGYGFVNYSTPHEAQLACTSLNGYRIGSKYLKVSFKTAK